MDKILPKCNECDQCYYTKSKKYGGYTYYCVLTGRDVGQSHFGMNSPKYCPKRNSIESYTNTNIKNIIEEIDKQMDYYNNKVHPDQSRFDRGCAMGAVVALMKLKEYIEGNKYERINT